VKVYLGTRGQRGGFVTVQDGNKPPVALDPGFKHCNHSPDGFEWGYGGSGPAQLAFAILLDHLGSVPRALALHQMFKWSVISNLRSNEFRLTADEVSAWCRDNWSKA
jgi:hypothetical protein